MIARRKSDSLTLNAAERSHLVNVLINRFTDGMGGFQNCSALADEVWCQFLEIDDVA
jgi:hypothetical protein